MRREHLDRAWNLARRFQRRLLADHGAVGVTLVDARFWCWFRGREHRTRRFDSAVTT
ncbi:hypothetical protein [Streptomyces sp. NPDC001340]